MLKSQVQKALNEQLNREAYSAYLYFSMSAWLNTMNLPGFGQWMYAQGLEELTHVQKLFGYIQQRGGSVTLGAIVAPKSNWNSALELFEETLAHEEFVTESINQLVAVTRETIDNATEIFLQWFVTEQVEEEESVQQVLQRLRLAGDNPSALLMLDSEMGKRINPTAAAPTE